MKLALGLDVQTNAKGGKFMSIETPVGRRGQEGGRVLCEQHRPGAVNELRAAGGLERAARQHKVAHLEEHAPLPGHQPHVRGTRLRWRSVR